VAARTKARTRAVDVLFEAQQRRRDPVTVLADRIAQADPPVHEYTVTLVEGVTARRERIDELISSYAQGWSIERMPAVDVAVLRLGTWEILFNDDVPDAVAVSEAVELAKSLSTDESPAYVNGLLSRILELKPTLAL
jgi:N utilization substance protein B